MYTNEPKSLEQHCRDLLTTAYNSSAMSDMLWGDFDNEHVHPQNLSSGSLVRMVKHLEKLLLDARYFEAKKVRNVIREYRVPGSPLPEQMEFAESIKREILSRVRNEVMDLSVQRVSLAGTIILEGVEDGTSARGMNTLRAAFDLQLICVCGNPQPSKENQNVCSNCHGEITALTPNKQQQEEN